MCGPRLQFGTPAAVTTRSLVSHVRVSGHEHPLTLAGLCPSSSGRVFVNHTFKSHLSIAAALHVLATAKTSELMEFPQGTSLHVISSIPWQTLFWQRAWVRLCKDYG